MNEVSQNLLRFTLEGELQIAEDAGNWPLAANRAAQLASLLWAAGEYGPANKVSRLAKTYLWWVDCPEKVGQEWRSF